jgi:hypothetical protein
MALASMVRIKAGVGDQDAARVYTDDAVRCLQSMPPELHPEIDSLMATLGQLALGNGQPEQAELLLRECLERCRLRSPQDTCLIASAESSLGEALTTLGCFEEAEERLLSSFDRQFQFPENGAPARETLGRIVRLYEAQGDFQQAQLWRAALQSGPVTANDGESR